MKHEERLIVLTTHTHSCILLGLMTSEVFPLAIRGQAVALAVQLNFLLNALVQFGVPVLQHAIGLAWTFGIFAILDLLR